MVLDSFNCMFFGLFFALGWWIHKDIPTGSAKTDDEDTSDKIENEDTLER